MRKVVVALGLALAVCTQMAGCALSGNDGARNQADQLEEDPAEEQRAYREEEFAQFREFVETQEPCFSFTRNEDFTFGSGDSAVNEGQTITGCIDGSGEEMAGYGCSEEPYLGDVSKFYWVGDKILQEYNDLVFDISETDAIYFGANRYFPTDSVAYTLSAENLEGVDEDSGGNIVYTFAWGKDDVLFFGDITNVDSGSSRFVFDKDGRLLEYEEKASGTADRDGKKISATGTMGCSYTDFGPVDVPAAPEKVDGKKIKASLEDAVSNVRAAIERIPENVTAVSEVTTSVDDVQVSRVHFEVLRDGTDSLTYLMENDNEDAGVLTFQVDGHTVVYQGDSLVSDSEGGTPAEMDNSQALAALDLAVSCSAYEYESGEVEYVLEVDRGKFMELNPVSGVAPITFMEFHYVIQPEGALQMVASILDGVSSGEAAGGEVHMESYTWYSDFGSTEIPSPY